MQAALIKWVIYLLAAGAVLLAVKLGVDKYFSAIERAAVADETVRKKDEEIADQSRAIDKLREMGIMSDTLNRQARKEAEDERKRAAKLWQDLQQAGKDDPSVGTWMDTPVPPVVRSLRRAKPAGDPGAGVLRPHGAPRPDPGTGLQRRDERSAGGGDRGAGRVALDAPRMQP